jgi:hypothetical protein
MATVNKVFLREEFNTLKTEFERLCADGKLADHAVIGAIGVITAYGGIMIHDCCVSYFAKSDSHNCVNA